MDTPRLLLEHYLKQLRLPTMLREFPKLGEQCAKEAAMFEQFLLRLVEQEMTDRERRATERRIQAARFPVSKSLETYDFLAIPSLNKKLVVELARCEWIGRGKCAGSRQFWDRQNPHWSCVGSGSMSARTPRALHDGRVPRSPVGGSAG